MQKAKNNSDVNIYHYLAATLLPSIIILTVGISYVKSIYDNYKFTESEINSIHNIDTVFKSSIKLQEIRGLTYLLLTGGNSFELDIDLRQEEFEKLIKHDARGHVHPAYFEKSLNELLEKSRQLYAASKNMKKSEAGKLFKNYSDLAFDLYLLNLEIARKSNLLLDPDLEAYTLMELSVIRIPRLANEIGNLRAQSSSFFDLEHSKIHFLEIQYFIISSQEHLKQMNASLKVINKKEFYSSAAEIDNDLKRYIDYINTTNFYNQSLNQKKQTFTAGTAIIQRLSKFNDRINNELHTILEARLTNDLYELFISIAGILFSIFVLLYFILRFYLSNRRAFAEEINLRNKYLNAEIRQRTIIDTMIDGLITIDSSGLIASYNPAAEKIFQYSAEEVIGKNVKMLMPEPYQSEHDAYLNNFLTTGKKKIIGIGREVLGLRKDGSTFPLDLSVAEMVLDGKIVFSGTVRDITERKYIEKMKNEFISTVSHELRTPLTSIRGSLGLLSGGAVGEIPEQAIAMLNIANNNTERLLILINDILDIQKIESGQMVFKFKNISLIPFLEQALQDNVLYASQFGVKFTLTSAIQDVKIYADKDRLMQVMANLLSNAAKFSPEGDTVDITVARHENLVRISVTDHGPGIPENFKDKVFEKFTQSDSSDTKKKGGTGLGLSITKIIMEKHGGVVDFVSHEGIGSTFYIELPELFNETATDIELPIQNVDKHKESCVLIVEDDPDIAALLRRMLAEAGYNSDIAYNAEEAYKLLESKRKNYKAITLDLILPGEDGISFLNNLRSKAETYSIPVIVVSVKANETKKELNGGAVSVVDWLQKPIDQNRLIDAIRSAAGPNRLPKVLHVEDESDIHQIVKNMLQSHCDLSWTTTVKASEEALRNENFDLVLLDINLPDGSGLDLLQTIEETVFPPRVIIFSASDVTEEYADKVSAVLVKSKTDNQSLSDAINSIIHSSNKNLK